MGNFRHVMKTSDGGFMVSKEIIVATSFILLLLGALVPTVYGYATLNSRVDALEDEYNSAGPEHTQIIGTIDERLNAAEKQLALLENKLDNIQASIVEIKADIREIKQKI